MTPQSFAELLAASVSTHARLCKFEASDVDRTRPTEIVLLAPDRPPQVLTPADPAFAREWSREQAGEPATPEVRT